MKYEEYVHWKIRKRAQVKIVASMDCRMMVAWLGEIAAVDVEMPDWLLVLATYVPSSIDSI